MKKVLVLMLALAMVVVPMIASAEPIDVAVIIKATTSDFWQYVLVGAQNYAFEHPDRVTVTLDGPPSEADIDQQVTILENHIATNPDAIVIASTSSDATIPALEEAQEKGIVVITIDNRLNEDVYDSFLATNNYVGGGLAAEQMVASWEAAGIDYSTGKIGVVNAMAGVQVLVDREGGFRDKMAEIAPGIEILETRFVDNDMTKAISAAEDMVSANPDLIGMFGCNNVTGDGVCRVISEQELSDKVIGIAFDSDPEEIAGLESGALKALVLQDPYGMGYKGVDFAWKKLNGEEIEKEVDTGATIVTIENFYDDAIQGLLDPMTLKKY